MRMMKMMKWGAMGVGLMVLSACASEPARTEERGGDDSSDGRGNERG